MPQLYYCTVNLLYTFLFIVITLTVSHTYTHMHGHTHAQRYTHTNTYINFIKELLYLRISSSVSPPSDSMLDTLGLILGEFASSSVEPP